MIFLEVWLESGVYSRVTAGWLFKTHVCSATSGLLSSYEGQLRNIHEAWPGITDPSPSEAVDGGFLSTCHNDIRIPIKFQQESGIFTC